MKGKRWEEEVQKVPGYEVEWYVVYEVSETSIDVLDYYRVDEDKIEALKGVVANIIHDLKTISEKELKGVPIEKRKVDAVIRGEGGYISMSLVAESMLVMAGLKKKH